MSAATEHRKLAAILFADMVGFARLRQGTALDLREDMLARAGRCLAEHRGRLVKTMGDGFLADFDTALDAVSCALALQVELSARNTAEPKSGRYWLRVGIHVGEVVEVTGADGARDIVGEHVNLASRTEGLAAPGGICLTETGWKQARDATPASFRRLGALRVKHVPGRVVFYHRAAPEAGWAASLAHQARIRLPGGTRAVLAGLAALVAVVGLLALWPRVSEWIFATPESLTRRGLALLERYDRGENLSAALKTLNRAANPPGRNAVAEAALAWAHWLEFNENALESTRTDAAQRASNALALNKDLPLGHKVLGLIALHEARYQEASNHFLLATGLANQSRGDDWVALARVQRHFQNEAGAAANLRRAEQRATNDWQAWHALGKYYADEGKLTPAGLALSNALALVPDSPLVLSDLGALHLLAGQDATGIELTRRSLDLRPTPEACARLGAYSHRRKQFLIAANWCDQAAKLRPGDYVQMLWTALTLRDASDHPSHNEWRDRAEETLNRIQARLPSSGSTPPLLLAHRGLSYALLGQNDAARSDLEAAESRGAGEAAVLTYVALGYEHLGDAANLARVKASLNQAQTRPNLSPNGDNAPPVNSKPLTPPFQ